VSGLRRFYKGRWLSLEQTTESMLTVATVPTLIFVTSLVEQGYGPPASDILEIFEADRKKQGDKIRASHSTHDVEKKSNIQGCSTCARAKGKTVLGLQALDATMRTCKNSRISIRATSMRPYPAEMCCSPRFMVPRR
jgi:hypothetical protein